MLFKVSKYLKYTIFMCVLGCVSKDIVPPIEPLSSDEIEQSISKLANQSFEFAIKFEKPGMKGSFKGIATNGRAKVEGVWEFEGDKEKFIGIGIGDKEWKMENGKWKMGQRTHYTDPVSTIKLVCSTGGYKFKSKEGESFLYEFAPNLLFMEPKLFGGPTDGILWINIKTGLPEKVIAKAENIKWEFEVKNIEGEYEIISPLATTYRIEIIVNSGDEVILPSQVAEILKHRFELYGFSGVKYELKGNSIILEFGAESFSTGLMQSLVQPGKVELYIATYPNEAQYELKGAHFVGGDPTKPVFLNENIECKLVDTNFESGMFGGSIELVFDKDLPEDKHIAVVVDGEVIGLLPKVWGKSLKIEGDKLTWIKIKLSLPGLGLRIKD